MRIRVLLFALYRDLAGAEELEIELPVGATVRELLAAVREHRGLSVLPDRPAVAINHVYALDLDAVLDASDEVALLPPVAGG
jgi:molybdopterin converting factor small subunit